MELHAEVASCFTSPHLANFSCHQSKAIRPTHIRMVVHMHRPESRFDSGYVIMQLVDLEV